MYLPVRLHSAFKFFLLACAALCSVTCHAIPAKSQPVDGVNSALAYILPGSKNVQGYNIDTYYHPASTQKLLTALAAILYLGPDYRLVTSHEIKSSAMQGMTPAVSGGVLNADVLLRFSGDPTLTIEKYRTLLSALGKSGIKQINGKVILDVSRFGGQSRGSGWSWDDLPVCFTAPSSAIILNRNCAYAELKTNGPGSHAEPLIPAGSPIKIKSDAIAIKNKDYGGDCILEANLFLGNEYHITGCVPAENKGKPWPLSLAVSDPVKWGFDWTGNILKSLGISVSGGLQVSFKSPEGYSILEQNISAPLYDLVNYMLQRSNNLYADSIAKNIAYEYYHLPATYHRAAQALRSILYKYAKIDLGSSYIVDGSGLSPHNLLTPRVLLEILQFMSQNDDSLHLIAALPVSGKSGTMQWRASTVNPPLKEHVIAKTGTLQNVSNLAGFVVTQSGGLAPFVLFENSITYSQRVRDQVKAHRIASPHLGYERYVLEKIYNEQAVERP